MACIANRRNFYDRSRTQGYEKKSYSLFDNKRNAYFCYHCKMPGHTIRRCYKNHGYPPHFKTDKDKKGVASLAQSNEKEIQGTEAITFTAHQYQKLFQLIAKDNSIEEVPTQDDHDYLKAAYAAGK